MTTSHPPGAEPRGAIAWMVHNRVTPNLIMLFLLLGGLFLATRIKQEVFPEFDLDQVQIRVSYPGASPAEVEQGIILVIEEAIRGTNGIEEIRSTAAEGSGTVTVELLSGADQNRVSQDIKQAVDAIRTFPIDAEEPTVSVSTRRREVLSIQLYGDVSERALREIAEQVRDGLLAEEGITQVDVVGGRALEVHVEVSQHDLRAHGLTLQDIANRIGVSSVELPGGSIETTGGELLLRVTDRRDWADEFATVPILTTGSGSILRLGDIASVQEGFEDVNRRAKYNGKPSIGLSVYRVGKQTPIGVASIARATMNELEADMPEGVDWAINADRSIIYKQRLTLLMKNAFIGLVLVLIFLGLFLEHHVAFWVTMGIPISFLGSLLFLPWVGVSINMISMFAFIIALGIVVDDAIIAGENIYEYRTRGMSFADAAIQGARDVAVPVTFSILTNVAAFLPLYFVPGFVGNIWRVIPMVVITVFMISWVESLLILPAHLSHRSGRTHAWERPLIAAQTAFSALVARFIRGVYGPVLMRCLKWRTVTIAVGVATLILVMGFVLGGRIGLILMPRTESDQAVATAVLPVGSPLERAEAVEALLLDAIDEIAERHGGDRLIEGAFSLIDENRVQVFAYMTPPSVRPITTGEVAAQWRTSVGSITGIQFLRFESDRGGPGSGAGLTVELSHRDIDMLDRASAALAEALSEFPNVKDVDDGYTPGKEQLDFQLLPAGESFGLTSSEIARQVRNAFYGARALRQQRERNEVSVFVRFPQAERASEYDIESLLITTPQGRDVPLREIAEIVRGRSYTSIERRDARRTVTVTANVEPIGETDHVLAAMNETLLPQVALDFPGLSFGYEGRQADMKESLSALFAGFGLAMVVIYFLLAIPFRSYTQPLIVMIAIPFGIVGAVIGHVIMGYSLSVLSLMGIVALSGVVVNDSLVLVDYANRRRREGASAVDAIHDAGLRRFRPVILTTLTTFGGLAPMIFETSRQARFMIPMALPLGFGIVFATAITLVIVPSLYLAIEDAKSWLAVSSPDGQKASPTIALADRASPAGGR